MIVAGFGCRSGAGAASLAAALAAAGGPLPTALAALADRWTALSALADALGLPAIPIAADRIADIDTPTRSAASLAARGAGSVAEAVALAAAGPGARLLVSRRISPDRMATCAIAQGSPA